MDRLERAFQMVKRADFLPDEEKSRAEFDTPLPIGFEQTNSQPSTVHMMLDWLGVQEGDNILDVGSGSGWTTALLAYLVGPSGTVYAVEKVPELVDFGRQNCIALRISNVVFHEAGNTYGLPKFAPFDRILVSASADRLPHELLNQLKIGGRLVIPVEHTILSIDKVSNTEFETTKHPGFIFVPLIP